MAKLHIHIILLLTLLLLGCEENINKISNQKDQARVIETLSKKAKQINEYIKTNNEFNDSIALLINMKPPSGQFRFFIYDLKNDQILDKGLVTHGEGSETDTGLVFKNIVNSLATSLGKYRMGNSYIGDFGKAYKMYGLESTNDKAFERFIVFHSHPCVPNKERNQPICLSQGCPTVSPEYFEIVASYLDRSRKPILMEIYYE